MSIWRPGEEHHSAIREVCDRLIPVIQNKAKSCGWAAAVHGSKIRDLDILAVPWSTNACELPYFLEAIRSEIVTEMGGDCYLVNPPGEYKSLCRRAYTLMINSEQIVHTTVGAYPFIDLSVIDVRFELNNPNKEITSII